MTDDRVSLMLSLILEESMSHRVSTVSVVLMRTRATSKSCAVEVAVDVVEPLARLLQRGGGQHDEHARPLPHVLQADLAERGAKARVHHVAQRRERRALVLQRPAVREVQLREQDADAGVMLHARLLGSRTPPARPLP